ncbi:MAG: epoxyqueuosine reductase [Clostridium sp.]|nr:epoxyqueuosine reductase [Clostridium sp.]
MEPTGKVKEIASKILSGKEAFPFGICSFEQILPCLECRAKQRIPQDAASVLVCLFPYYTGEHKERNISRYAMVTDYHMIAGEYLNRFCKALQEVFPQNQFEPFTDNSPIREVSAAFHAGLGRRGKNGLILHPKYGSYVFIGEVVTDLVLQPDQTLNPGECIGCRKCQNVCPQGALQSDGSVCLERCRSHITQKKGELTDWEIGQIQDGGLIWGCDICNDVCPMNQEAKVLTPVPEFLESTVAVLDAQIAERLLKTRAYNYRGKKTILRNIQLLEGANEDDR